MENSNKCLKRKTYPQSKNKFTITDLEELLNSVDSEFDFSSDDEDLNNVPLNSNFPEEAVLEDVVLLPPTAKRTIFDVEVDENYLEEDLIEGNEQTSSETLPNILSENVNFKVLADQNLQILENVEFEVIDQFVKNVDPTYMFTDKKNIKWKRNPEPFEKVEFEFIAEEEIDVHLEESTTFYFDKYFTEEFYANAATFTNIYAAQKDVNGFKPTNSAEIRRLFALHILMGALKLPRTRIYWNKILNIDLVTKAMPFDRFSQLRNNLHLVNNLEIPKNCKDKFFKVRPVIDSVRSRCLQFNLERNLCIDEQMIPFKGHHTSKQYMKGKPCPWGIKVYMLCGKSGRPYDFIIYQGKSTGISETDQQKFNHQ